VKHFFKNSKIKILDVYNNGIAFSESDSLAENHVMTEINFTGNHLDDRCKGVLKKIGFNPNIGKA
jgi:hypothetical protein